MPTMPSPLAADAGAMDAQQSLRASFEAAGRALNDDLMGVQAEMARRLEGLSARLRDTRLEIDRLTHEIETMKNDRVHDLVKTARERLGAMQ